MSVFEKSWVQVWTDLALVPSSDLFELLLGAYSEPQRHYHTKQHLAECLSLFGQVQHFAAHPGEVAIALWFHDSIYDARGKSNEQLSADWALRVLRDASADTGIQQRVERLILATKHDAAPTDSDQQLLVDIDLSILGANSERFAEYDRQVRAEYSWVPDFIYNMKRKGVLKAFLARPSIYNTNYFRENYEQKTRINLAAVV